MLNHLYGPISGTPDCWPIFSPPSSSHQRSQVPFRGGNPLVMFRSPSAKSPLGYLSRQLGLAAIPLKPSAWVAWVKFWGNGGEFQGRSPPRWWQPGTPGQENQLRLAGIIPLFLGFHTCQVVRISSINGIFHVPFKFGSLEIWGEDARMMSLFFWMLRKVHGLKRGVQTFCWILEMRIYVAFQQSNALEDPPEPMLFECWTFSRMK